MTRRLLTGLGIHEGAVSNAATAFFREPDHRRTSFDDSEEPLHLTCQKEILMKAMGSGFVILSGIRH
ncbi:hypothetical protein BQ8482_400019 [Mesorhizobium delmotii]|uniref:Uncharacterized protein n=1 Tax=Mesorhizobium delmotii TaxID=1631247 RepID=A0A2P9ASY8_9HYPH|nr:hypothetical protein BQ8482_400019 [Mesorhizobium delmotii]